MAAQTERLWRQLPGVRMRERSRFLFFAGLTTHISLAQTLGLAGSESLLLARYGASVLPEAFIAAAIVTILGSLAYAARVGGVRNDALFVQMLAGAGTLLAAAVVAIEAGHSFVLPATFCFFYLTQAVFVNHMWTFTGDYFDTVASKRLIPLFTIGGSVGGFLGGILAVAVTKITGPVSLVLAWAVLLVAAAVILRIGRRQLLRWGPLEPDEADETSVEGIESAIHYLRASPLVRWLTLSALGMMLSLFVAQYLYSDVFARAFPSATELAFFFGIYLAITNLIEIAVEVRVTPSLIHRFGVPAANLIHPLLTLLSFGGLAIQYGLVAGVAARMNRELLENAVAGPVRALVYNAMPLRRRGRTRAFLEGIVVYAGMALAGLVLLLIEDPDPRSLCAAGGAMALVYLFANVKARREYIRTLVRELRAGRLDLSDLGDEVGRWEASQLANLWEQLLREDGTRPSRWLLQLTPDLAARGVTEPLIRAASHAHSAVRCASIDALASVPAESVDQTFVIALDDADAGVRLAAIRALRSGGAAPESLAPRMKKLLSDPDAAVRAEAAACAGAEGANVLEEMIGSASTDETLAGLRCAPPRMIASVRARVDDAEPAVRAAALECIARVSSRPPVRFQTLLAGLGDPDPRIRRAGVLLLAKLDVPEALSALATALGDPSSQVRVAIENTLGSFGDDGTAAVEPQLRASDERRVESAYRIVAMAQTPAARSILAREFRHRVRNLWFGIIHRENLPAGDGVAKSFLRVAYGDAIRRNRRLAFRILELTEDKSVVANVEKALRGGSIRARGDALEVLSSLGDRETARMMVLAHEEGPLEDRLPEIRGFVPVAADGHAIVAAALESGNRWMRMAARAIVSPHANLEHEVRLMERLLALKQVPLFAHLSLEQLEALQQITREVEYVADETIVKEGERSGELYLLIEGRVRVFKNFGMSNETALSTQCAVSYFGEMAALDEQPRSATVVALERSRLLCLDGKNLKELIVQMPEMSLEILRVLTARVRAAERRLVEH